MKDYYFYFTDGTAYKINMPSLKDKQSYSAQKTFPYADKSNPMIIIFTNQL